MRVNTKYQRIVDFGSYHTRALKSTCLFRQRTRNIYRYSVHYLYEHGGYYYNMIPLLPLLLLAVAARTVVTREVVFGTAWGGGGVLYYHASYHTTEGPMIMMRSNRTEPNRHNHRN